MPDSWEDVPIELFGERPTVLEFLNKGAVKPAEVESIEKGRDVDARLPNSFGDIETK